MLATPDCLRQPEERTGWVTVATSHPSRRRFHHLIPKQTHSRYLGKCLPAGVVEAAAARDLLAEPSRDFLNRYGSMLCRFCHSTVHRLAPNAVLAERFCTIKTLLSEPTIQRFIAFTARQKLTARGAR